MNRPSGARLLKKVTPVALIAVALLFAYAPGAFGFSTGMNSDNPAFPDNFNEVGCTASGCHGGGEWADTPENRIRYTIIDAEGNEVTSGAYVHDATYTINVTLVDELNPDAENHAGFYMSATAGEFQAESEAVQVTGEGLEVSHTGAGQTEWSFTWTAPEAGAVAFQLLVNDVDGDGNPNAEDNVYRQFFALTDEHGAQLGAAGDDHAEAHYGLALPQYWLGLVALASMIFVILFAFVYLKFVNPHNTDQKDR